MPKYDKLNKHFLKFLFSLLAISFFWASPLSAMMEDDDVTSSTVAFTPPPREKAHANEGKKNVPPAQRESDVTPKKAAAAAAAAAEMGEYGVGAKRKRQDSQEQGTPSSDSQGSLSSAGKDRDASSDQSSGSLPSNQTQKDRTPSSEASSAEKNNQRDSRGKPLPKKRKLNFDSPKRSTDESSEDDEASDDSPSEESGDENYNTDEEESPAKSSPSQGEGPAFPHVRVVLLKPSIKSDKEALLAEAELNGPLPVEEGINLYLLRRPVTQPSWVMPFSKHIDENLLALNGDPQIKSGVLFLEKSGRRFAILFGPGARYLVRDGSTEENFGLHTTLNSIDFERVKSMGTKTVAANSRYTNVRFNFESSISHFPNEGGVLQSISGKHKAKGRSYKIAASGYSIFVNKRTHLEELPALCGTLLTHFQSPSYKEWFPWADLMKLVASKGLLNSLNDHLLQNMDSTVQDARWHLVEPLDSMAEEEESAIASYKIGTSQTVYHTCDEVFQKLRKEIRRRQGKDSPQDKFLKFLKTTKIVGFDEHGTAVHRWNLYKSIVLDVTIGNDLYALRGGQWLQIDRDYNAQINRAINALVGDGQVCPLLPPLDKDEDEGDYNERVVAANPTQFLLMDKRNVGVTGKQGDVVEVCDVLSANRELIVVKKGTDSSNLSHLFAQGVVPAFTLLQDPSFRVKFKLKFIRAELLRSCRDNCNNFHKLSQKDENEVREKLFKKLTSALNKRCNEEEDNDVDEDKLIEDLVNICCKELAKNIVNKDTLVRETTAKRAQFDEFLSCAHFNPADYTVVFVIATDKDQVNLSDVLPFFSRLNLKLSAEKIRKLGYKVAVKIVKDKTPPKKSSDQDPAQKGKKKAANPKTKGKKKNEKPEDQTAAQKNFFSLFQTQPSGQPKGQPAPQAAGTPGAPQAQQKSQGDGAGSSSSQPSATDSSPPRLPLAAAAASPPAGEGAASQSDADQNNGKDPKSTGKGGRNEKKDSSSEDGDEEDEPGSDLESSSTSASDSDKDKDKRKNPQFFKPKASEANKALNAISGTLEAEDGEKFKEFLVSGESSGCALYCLGFPDHASARQFLLAKADNPETRDLIYQEAWAEINEGWEATPEYRGLDEEESRTHKDLNEEMMRLSRDELKLTRIDRSGKTQVLTPTKAQIDTITPPNKLAKYNRLKLLHERALANLRNYLKSENLIKKFINKRVVSGKMITYLPKEGERSILDALARNLDYNLVIYGKNNAGKLVVVHEFVWDRTKPIKHLLHTRYKNSNGKPILGGVSGTRLQNSWNHFNLLSPDEQVTIQTVRTLVGAAGNEGVNSKASKATPAAKASPAAAKAAPTAKR